MLATLIFTSGALSFLKGDLNGDDMIDNKDVVTLFRYVSGVKINCVKENCDINGDGAIDNKDVVALFKLVSGKPVDTDIMTKDDGDDTGDFGELHG